VNVRESFGQQLAAEWADGGDDVELLPAQLARAAVRTLGVAGVGLSLHEVLGRSTPLGASDALATLAERLQFTTGSGPCMLAAGTGCPFFAAEEQLRGRWPAFHDMLVRHTPFRSVVALPLPGELRGIGALDLYLTPSVGVEAVDAIQAHDVARIVAAELAHAAAWSEWSENEGPAWTQTDTARQRARVWLASGMVSLALGVDTTDALAVLRAVAYASDRTVDAVAVDVIERRLPLDQLDGHIAGGS
jgi:hypothetical protein